MTKSNKELIEESSSGQTDDWFDVERRPLLKALGVGATLSFGSGVAAAGRHAGSGDGIRGKERGRADGDARIDPHFGYATMDATTIPDALDPDHEVELRAAPPVPATGQPPLLFFDPVGLQVEAGDVVQFTFVSPDHTVTTAHPDIGPPRRIPEAAPPFSSPVLGPGAAWLYRFEHEGVYDLYCAPHQLLGMVMRVVVGDLEEGAVPEYAQSIEGLPNPEELGAFLNQLHEDNEGCVWPFLTIAEVLGTGSLDVMNIQADGDVPFSAVAEELGYEFPPPTPDVGTAPTVQVRDHEEYGQILAGPDGLSLYMFEQDTQGAGESSCYDGCADLWPPLTVDGEPTAGDAVSAELDAFERETGEMQVTLDGWPVYHYGPDEEPGDVGGQGVNDVWWLLGPDGTPVREGSTD